VATASVACDALNLATAPNVLASPVIFEREKVERRVEKRGDWTGQEIERER